MKKHQTRLISSISSYSLSKWVEASVQTALLAHAISLIFSSYDGNDMTASKPSSLYLSLLVVSFIIFGLLFSSLHLRTQFLYLHQASILTWLIFSSVISFRTYMPSLIVGLIIISIGLMLFKGMVQLIYCLPLVIWIGRIIYLVANDRALIPNGFPEGYWKPMISEVTVLSLQVSMGVLSIMAVILLLAGRNKRSPLASIPQSVYYGCLIIAAAIHFICFGLYLTYRVRFFVSSTFDMGIFTQMFHGMLKTGQPLTTLERDGLLSHFSVHISPTIYLLLPLFAISPHPLTLQLAQVLVVGSAVIPFYLLAKHYAYSKKLCILWAALFLLQPGLILSGAYDFHENIFLPPMLLWLIYSISKGKLVPVVIFTALTIGIKEDVFIYILAVSCWLFFGAKDRRITSFSPSRAKLTAVIMGLLSVIIFILSVKYLQGAGAGAMTGKFNNLQGFPDWGLFGVIANMILNPMLLLSTVFVAPKLNYILISLTSMGFIPLLCSRLYLLFLWMPFVVINLLSNWLHQYEINFQYGYGSHTLLLFMAMCSISLLIERTSSLSTTEIDTEGRSERKPRIKQYLNKHSVAGALMTLAVISALLHSVMYLASFTDETMQIFNPPGYIQETRDFLSQVPRDQIIVADGYFTTDLADIPELYDMSYYKIRIERPSPDLLILMRSRLANYKSLPSFLEMGYSENASLSTAYVAVFSR